MTDSWLNLCSETAWQLKTKTGRYPCQYGWLFQYPKTSSRICLSESIARMLLFLYIILPSVSNQYSCRVWLYFVFFTYLLWTFRRPVLNVYPVHLKFFYGCFQRCRRKTVISVRGWINRDADKFKLRIFFMNVAQFRYYGYARLAASAPEVNEDIVSAHLL